MFNTAVHKYRAASKGKPFTRNERVNLILAERIAASRKASLHEAILHEKAKISAERREREKAQKVRAALLANPEVKKINQKKDGTLFYQPRVQGKLGKAVIVG